jgi:hypothetical protein
MPTTLSPTRLIEPGERTAIRTEPGPDGSIDLRTLPLDPNPDSARHFAVAAVGAGIGSQFDAREIPGPAHCPPGAVLVTYGPPTAPGATPDQVAVVVGLAERGQAATKVTTVALWPGLNPAWPEIVRTSVVFAASHHTRSPR